jgi:glycosyltransferase involved in cell wall biosynthesis
MADWVVAISNASRMHFLDTFPHVPEERVRVIHPCSRFMDTKNEGIRPKSMKDIPSGRFWLSVGTIEPRKNQRKLAEAYARYLSLGNAPMKLVFAGKNGWLMEDFQSYLEELGIAEDVVITDYVSDNELIWLYRNCFANLYPSFFEGFGLPVLEGMQFGAATIASSTTSIPEIVGNAGILLDPKDIDAWVNAMACLVADEDERKRLGAAAKVQAACFDWKQSARALLELYEEALTTPKRNFV